MAAAFVATTSPLTATDGDLCSVAAVEGFRSSGRRRRRGRWNLLPRFLVVRRRARHAVEIEVLPVAERPDLDRDVPGLILARGSRLLGPPYETLIGRLHSL